MSFILAIMSVPLLAATGIYILAGNASWPLHC